MSDDYTRPDGGLFEGPLLSGGVVTEVDAILGAVIDGRYEVVSRLGQGGMGFVYEARDLTLDRDVVIKTLRPELVNNEKTAERFSREAMMQARIDHPNVIVVTAHGVTADYGAYYVMERLVGQDLGALLEPLDHPLPLPRVISIVSQVAAALGAAHENAIVHRDLKPENIFLTTGQDGNEFVKVLDFGLARMLDTGNKLTETGAVIGTPRYMAPEQCHGQKADARADVYSLGLVMYEMLSGRQPYAKLNTYEILGKKMFDDVPPLSELEPAVTVDPRVEAFVMRCLSKVPEARIADGASFGHELRALQEALLRPLPQGAATPRLPRVESGPSSFPPPPSGIKPPSSLPSSPALVASQAPPAAAPKGQWLLVALGLGIVLLTAGLGAGVWLWLRSGDPTPTPVPSAVEATEVEAPEVTPAPAVTVAIIHVRTEPAGAEVRHADNVFGSTPLELRIPADIAEGDTIQLRLEGYVTRSIRISSAVPTAHVRLHESP